MSRPRVALLFNLLQDVNILRPLARLAATALAAPVTLLLTHKFVERDTQGTWQTEIDDLAAEIGSAPQVYATPLEAQLALAGGCGLVVAGSESNLAAHTLTHDVLRSTPSSYLKVTLQHGFECVGFLHNRDHSKAHGRHITFAADVICGWCELRYMTAVAPGERAKYFLTGPSALIEPPPERAQGTPPRSSGLVCENLHSVRMRTSGDFRASFMDTFNAYCAALARQGRQVTIRPHPGGQYVVKQNVALPENVDIDNRPMYRVDLRDYAYGLSAPSSVVIDMVLAGIPTAVWRDEDGIVDTSHYEGLAPVSTLADWLAFERDVRLRPDALLRRQAAFLGASGMLADPEVVRRRFLDLLGAGLAMHGRAA